MWTHREGGGSAHPLQFHSILSLTKCSNLQSLLDKHYKGPQDTLLGPAPCMSIFYLPDKTITVNRIMQRKLSTIKGLWNCQIKAQPPFTLVI